MGRAHDQRPRDKNKATLPQTPRRDIAKTNDDLELAKEVNELYDLEAKPGFDVTAAKRKGNQK
ncbi:YfhD family protein [Desertibacillus haloalkaliphilus]|uniref:YfhD family protein n=1 Tax=Desertibacillus haloalkaliphilus TaxID=1328930 RepID=UPI001C27C8B2|nr:YfhD family protein [Desertibacillus haloalkaliphilus]MBU8905810.1 YfhD family protein [Desertibacillus haloalkaliphilus]